MYAIRSYYERVLDQLGHRQQRALQLAERFAASQTHAQSDPWRERAEGGVDAHEFHPVELTPPLRVVAEGFV